jgi:hypothetical protein
VKLPPGKLNGERQAFGDFEGQAKIVEAEVAPTIARPPLSLHLVETGFKIKVGAFFWC